MHLLAVVLLCTTDAAHGPVHGNTFLTATDFGACMLQHSTRFSRESLSGGLKCSGQLDSWHSPANVARVKLSDLA